MGLVPKAYRPGHSSRRCTSVDRRRRLRPDGAASTADAATAVHDHPAAAECHRLLHLGHAQRATVEDLIIRHARMLGRPTLFLPASTTPRSRPRSSSIGSSPGKVRRGRASAASATSSGCGSSSTRLAHDPGASKSRLARRRLEPAAVHDGRSLGARPSAGASRACTPGPRVPRRSADQLVPRLPDQRQGSRGHPDARDGLDLDDPLPPRRRRRRGPSPTETIDIATTRPETLLGDTAVAVHPDDPRYTSLVGRAVLIPFVNRIVPIIADEHVDQALGTGAVKITPAHDHDDYAMAQRHGLPIDDVRRRRPDQRGGDAVRRPGSLRGPDARSSLRSRHAATSSKSGPRNDHRAVPAATT